MKKIIFSITVIALLISCNKNKETETVTVEETETTEMPAESTMMENDTTATEAETERLYSCSMHPEVQGKLNDKCSECGMELSELVPVKK